MHKKIVWFVALAVSTLTTPVSAQEITLKELVNTTITSTVWRAQTERRNSGEYSGKIKSIVEIASGGPNDPIQFTQTGTWYGKNGRTSTWTSSGSGRLAKPNATPFAGGGEGVGFFLDGTLYYIRTFKSGGFKFEFKLARTSNGLSCTARESFLRERGAGEIRLNATTDNHPIVIVSSKQISSTCQVTKR